MQEIEKLEEELYQSQANALGLEESLEGSRVADLTELVSKTGKLKGELTGMTSLQYEKLIGKKPPPGLLTKAPDATTYKVRWEQVLDQLASGRGFDDIQELKDAIEAAYSDKQKLAELKSKHNAMRNEIIDELRAEPGVQTVRREDVCPQFPENACAAEVTMVDGLTFRMRRQHSYWRIDAGDKSFKIRYAHDARKVARTITRVHAADIMKERERQVKMIIPKLKR